MIVTEVRLKLAEHDPLNDNLLAFCTVVMDDELAITDMKLLTGKRGKFISMPSRRVMDHCPQCNRKNHLHAAYCNYCGCELDASRGDDQDCFLDTTFPINNDFRGMLEAAVIEEYNRQIFNEVAG